MIELDRITCTSNVARELRNRVVCQQFCELAGASMPECASTFKPGRAAEAGLMPAMLDVENYHSACKLT